MISKDDLKAARQAYDAAIEEAERQRAAIVVRAINEDMPQKDVIEATGYSRETVRRITAAGRAYAEPPRSLIGASRQTAPSFTPTPALQIRTWNDTDDGSYSWKPAWSAWEDLDPEGDHVGDIKIQVRVKPTQE